MDGHHRRGRGFTIIEMLVVIGVLALLVGILVPALSGVIRKGRKQTELNSLRQVGMAWILYANSSNDYLVPGNLDIDVQQRWRVTYEFPNRRVIPPAPNFDQADRNIAGPWTWRLLPFMDYNFKMVHGYRDQSEADAMVVIEQLNDDVFEEAEAIAEEPGFGYNAFYVGGYWEIPRGSVPRYRYYDARARVNGIDKQVPVVSRSMGTIKRSTELVVFCSAALQFKGLYHDWNDTQPGWFLVEPPLRADESRWSVPGASLGDGAAAGMGADVAAAVTAGMGGGGRLTTGNYDPSKLLVVANAAAAPIGRYTGLPAILQADGHTSVASPGELADQRKWIDVADRRDFDHTP